MKLFGRKPQEPATEHVGGCSEHDMRGPARSSVKEADNDARRHGERMHGSAHYPGGYIERRR